MPNIAKDKKTTLIAMEMGKLRCEIMEPSPSRENNRQRLTASWSNWFSGFECGCSKGLVVVLLTYA